MIFLGLALLLSVALACQVSIPLSTDTNTETPPRQESNPPEPQIVQVTRAPVQVVPTPTLAPVPSGVADEQMLLVNLYARVNPSVVNITDYGTEGNELVPVSQGSGFVYDNEGNIITNAHVVVGADRVEVTFSDASVRPAEVLGQDLHSDLAVIHVDDMPEGVAPLPMGNMQGLAVGQTVVAIGNPFGLSGTLTRGVVSALGRSISALTPGFTIPQSIQTDAAINPGNSGGPLLNLQGEVIGVNAQIETGGTGRSNIGIGFAIPVSILQRVVPDLIANGEHAWGYLGVRGGSLNPFLVEAMNLQVDKGAYISEVIPGGPSEGTGLRGSDDTARVDGRTMEVGGDVVIAIDGQPVYTFEDMLIYVALNTSPGDEVTLTIVRDGQTREVQVTLGARPNEVPTTDQLPLPFSPDATLPPDHP